VSGNNIPTVAQLIQRVGCKISSRTCNLCGKWGLFQVGEFTACLVCDTTAESRREAHLSEQS
jgi:hypothetical protein